MGLVYQCWWRIRREIHVFSFSNINQFYVLYPFATCLLTLPCTNLQYGRPASNHCEAALYLGYSPPNHFIICSHCTIGTSYLQCSDQWLTSNEYNVRYKVQNHLFKLNVIESMVLKNQPKKAIATWYRYWYYIGVMITP
jgi:hypothetical protein